MANFSVNSPLSPCAYVVASSTFSVSLLPVEFIGGSYGAVVGAGAATVVAGNVCNGYLALSFTVPSNAPLGAYDISFNMTSGPCSAQVIQGGSNAGLFRTGGAPLQLLPPRGTTVAAANWTMSLPLNDMAGLLVFVLTLCDLRGVTSLPYGALTMPTFAGNPVAGALLSRSVTPAFCTGLASQIQGNGRRALAAGVHEALQQLGLALPAANTGGAGASRQLVASSVTGEFSAVVTSTDTASLSAASSAGQAPNAWLQSTINSIPSLPAASMPLTSVFLSPQFGNPTLASVQPTLLVGGSVSVQPPVPAALPTDSNDSAPLVIGIFVAFGALAVMAAGAVLAFSDPRAAVAHGKAF